VRHRLSPAVLIAVILSGCTTGAPQKPQDTASAQQVDPVVIEDPSSSESPDAEPAPAPSSAAPARSAPEWRRDPALEALASKLGAKSVDLEIPCVEGDEAECERRALDRLFLALDGLLAQSVRHVRVLQLGDSHIAADYVTGTIRERLQEIFGDAGRGFVHADQRREYGGRRTAQRTGWKRTRAVDPGQSGQRFGFVGIALEPTQPGASMDFALDDESRLTIFYDATPKGDEIELFVGDELIGRADAKADEPKTELKTIAVPIREQKQGADTRQVRLVADPGTRIFGITFARSESGLFWDSVGPVGADAAVYLSHSAESMKDHVRLADPDLIVLMLGGNDALRVRQGRATLAKVKSEFAELVDRLKEARPQADCMVWGPMDAGDKRDGKIVSKSHISEIRDVLRKVSKEKGCAFWDLYAAMGGSGSVVRWANAKIMNEDLIHPRHKAGQLIGYLFADAFYRAYSQ
jgi:lysophospholipase L1-like esterase